MSADKSIVDLSGVLLKAGALYRAACDNADAVTVDSPLNVTGADPVGSAPSELRETRAKQTLYVGTRFSSGVAGTTVALTCILYRRSPVNSSSTATAIGASTSTVTSSAYTVGGKSLGELLAFDLAGATHYEVRAADPSSGSVDLVAWEA